MVEEDDNDMDDSEVFSCRLVLTATWDEPASPGRAPDAALATDQLTGAFRRCPRPLHKGAQPGRRAQGLVATDRVPRHPSVLMDDKGQGRTK